MGLGDASIAMNHGPLSSRRGGIILTRWTFEGLLLRDKKGTSPKDAQKGHPAKLVKFSLSLF
jgi:hypothetical protein